MCGEEQDDRSVSLSETEYLTIVADAYRRLVKNTV